MIYITIVILLLTKDECFHYSKHNIQIVLRIPRFIKEISKLTKRYRNQSNKDMTNTIRLSSKSEEAAQDGVCYAQTVANASDRGGLGEMTPGPSRRIGNVLGSKHGRRGLQDGAHRSAVRDEL